MSELPPQGSEEPVELWMPTGAGLLGMGILVLLTPLFTELTDQQWTIDLVVGVMMVMAGSVGLIIHQRKLGRAKRILADGQRELQHKTAEPERINISGIDASDSTGSHANTTQTSEMLEPSNVIMRRLH